MACIAVAGLVCPTAAEVPQPPPRPSYNLYGETGLIDMPSADMQPDGEISVTAGYFGGFLRNTISFQFLPWLETSYRYSVIQDFTPGPSDRTLFDRSFDIKIRLIEETERWPSVALGLRDFLGTGIYSSEYLAVTKGIDAGEWGQFRVTGGVGWGRFADVNGLTNPFCTASKSLCTRGGGASTGGTVNFGQFFQGPDIGFFGGIEWQTPIDGLSAKLEYSPDRYFRESRFSDFREHGQINVGLEYRPFDGVEIGAYYMYGSEFGVRVSLSGNPFRPIAETDLEPGPQPLKPRPPADPGPVRAALGRIVMFFDSKPPESHLSDPRLRNVVVHERLGTVRWAEAMLTERAGERCPDDLARAIDAELGVIDVVTFSRPGHGVLCTVALRPAGEQAVRLTARSYANYPVDWYQDESRRKEIADRLAKELEPDAIGLFGIEIAPERVQVYIENHRFRAMPQAVGRTARALARVMPPSVETFEITPVENSLPVSTIILRRSDLEDQVERPDAARHTWATATITDAKPVDWSDVLGTDELFPRFSWSVSPSVPLSLFDPDAPVRYDVSVVAAGSVELMPGLSANGAVTKSLFGNLDDITRKSNSQLEHVRSDIAEYLREGDPALTRLTVDYVTKLDDDVYARLSAGMLERMYAGVSGEVLWKPATQDWGLGLELNYVHQRGFDSLFDFRDYDTMTGHASFYWDTNFYGLSTEIDVGRYLAGDWGATFSLKRKFANGWEVGAFATFTNVPFSEFGEGSFDKGIYVSIPLNWALPYESRGSLSTIIRPLTRDGGQRLNIANRLYPIVEDNDAGGYRANWDSFWQ